MYGAQTFEFSAFGGATFENDVEMYGAQTFTQIYANDCRLRMM